MPKNFTGILSDTANPVASRDEYTGDVTGLASQLNSVVASGAELQDQRILRKYSEDITSIESQGAGYDQKMADLNLSMVKASAQNDMAAVTEYSQQIHRLRMGESAGTLSPTAASIRMQSLTKEWATRYPHLTADFKKLYAGAGAGGGGSGSDIKLDQDPQLKAANELVYEAERNGVSVAVILADRQRKMQAERSKDEAELKLKIGQDAQPEIEQFTNAIADVARKAAWDGLRSDLRNGTIDKNKWIVSLGAGRDAMLSGLRKYITGLEADNGIQFPADWKKQIYSQAVEPLDRVIESAKETDSTDNLKRLAEASMAVRDNRSEAALEKMFPGALYPIAKLTKDPFAFFESVDKILEAQKSKTSKIMQDKIAEFDPATRGMLRFIGEEPFRQMSERNLAEVLDKGEGAATVSAGPVLDKAMLAQAEQLITSPTLEPAQKENLGAHLIAKNPDIVKTNPAVRTLLQTSESFRSRADRILTQGIEAAAYDMDPTDFDSLNFGESDYKQAPASAGTDATEVSPSEEGGDSGGMYSYPAIARESVREAQTMADRLNQFYLTKIAGGSTVEEARVETGKLLVGAINSRTESAQKPTRAQQQEAAGKPTLNADREDMLHNAIVTAATTGKIKPALASRLLREMSGEDDPSVIAMTDGVFQDTVTGTMVEIKNGVLRVVKLN